MAEYPTITGFKNQIVLWDKRILRSEKAYNLKLKSEWVEYYLSDINKALKGN